MRASAQPEGTYLTAQERHLVRELQQDLEVVERPFAAMACRLGISEEELLEEARRLKEREIMRRFAAVLSHQKAGYAANALGLWVVPEERMEELGSMAASFAEVSHCYQRATQPGWPYNLFVMIHGHTREECEAVATEISRRSGLQNYLLLYSTREFKKVRVTYFPQDGA